MKDTTSEWLVIDLGGVVAGFRSERRLAALQHATGIPADVIHERLFASGLDHDAERGRYDTESIVSVILDALEHRISLPALIDAWSEAFEPNQELLDSITALPTQRALFTNNGPMLDLCLAGPLSNLASTFDTIICSWHLQATKPSPNAFTLAAERLRTPPSHLTLVDDSPTNTNAAARAGWKTITHISNGQTVQLLSDRYLLSEALDNTRGAYSTMAGTYIELFGSTDQVHPDDLALIARHLSIPLGAVLDIGCGPGHLTAYLHSLKVEVIGIDPVPEFINHARASNPRVSYELASMNELPVRDGSIAGILAWYSLIHVPPAALRRVLAEFRRAMTAGGRLVAGFFEGDDLAPFDHKVATAYRWPIDELSAELLSAGFVEIERHQRPADSVTSRRAHAAIVAVAG